MQSRHSGPCPWGMSTYCGSKSLQSKRVLGAGTPPDEVRRLDFPESQRGLRFFNQCGRENSPWSLPSPQSEPNPQILTEEKSRGNFHWDTELSRATSHISRPGAVSG